MLSLIGTGTSAHVRKRRVALAEKKIDCAFGENSPWAQTRPPAA